MLDLANPSSLIPSGGRIVSSGLLALEQALNLVMRRGVVFMMGGDARRREQLGGDVAIACVVAHTHCFLLMVGGLLLDGDNGYFSLELD